MSGCGTTPMQWCTSTNAFQHPPFSALQYGVTTYYSTARFRGFEGANNRDLKMFLVSLHPDTLSCWV